MSQALATQKTTTPVSANQPRFTEQQLVAANIETAENLPDLAQGKRHFMPLAVEYWSPEKEGEEKLVFIAGVENHEVPDMETGEIRAIECVLMLEKDGDQLKRWINASRILVGNIKDAIRRGEIAPMTTLTPVAIRYAGMKRTKNGKNAARWQIIPIITQ